MRTLIKALLLVCWLLGASTGRLRPGEVPDRGAATYYAVSEAVGLSMDGHRVTLYLAHRAIPGGAVSISAAVPGWMAAWPDGPDPASTSFSEASSFDGNTPPPFVSHSAADSCLP